VMSHPEMAKKPKTAHFPRLTPFQRGASPKPPIGHEWETITRTPSRSRIALRLLLRVGKSRRVATVHLSFGLLGRGDATEPSGRGRRDGGGAYPME
jgi:hypothetical protein